MSRFIEDSELSEKQKLAIKRACSYRQLIPSLDFNVDFYQQYLHFATPGELENDIITKETIKKIAHFNSPPLKK